MAYGGTSLGKPAKTAPTAAKTAGGFAGALGGNNFTIDKSGLGTQETANQKMAAAAAVNPGYGYAGSGSAGVKAPSGAAPAGGGGAGAIDALAKMMQGGGGMPGLGGGGMPQAPAAPASTPLTLTSNPDPAMGAFLASLAQRTQKQQAGENDPVSWSAERASDLAARDIYGGAAGAKKRKLEELSERGLTPGRGVGEGQLRAIDEAAMTRSARATADIGLAREKEQDMLDLQREGATNALYGQMGNFAQVPFQQQMAGQRLGLDAWQAQDRSVLERAGLAQRGAESAQNQQQNQMNMWLSLMRGLA